MSNTIRVFLAELEDNPNIVQFIYITVILISGFIIISVLSQSNYEFWRSVGFMVVWLVLISYLDPPPKALMNAKPFEKTDILDDQTY